MIPEALLIICLIVLLDCTLGESIREALRISRDRAKDRDGKK